MFLFWTPEPPECRHARLPHPFGLRGRLKLLRSGHTCSKRVSEQTKKIQTAAPERHDLGHLGHLARRAPPLRDVLHTAQSRGRAEHENLTAAPSATI